MVISTKNNCVHKINGMSALVVKERISENKYVCVCNVCKEKMVLKKKQVPTGAMWELDF